MTIQSSGQVLGAEYSETASDAFTRLSIAMCPGDDGTRPVDPTWPGSGIGYLSPAFSFKPPPPLKSGQAVTIGVAVRNLGTMGATGVFFESTYNIYIGNQKQGLVPIENKTIPLIPAGGTVIVQIKHTPNDPQVTHACLHARVMDTYSMLHYSTRVYQWSSFVNPQAGNRNVRIIPIKDASKPVAIPFMAKNFSEEENINPRLLITRIDRWQRVRDLEARFPLPFDRALLMPEELGASATRPPAGIPPIVVGGDSERNGTASDNALTFGHLRPGGETALWPRSDVAPHLRHQQFGFAAAGTLSGLARDTFDPLAISLEDFQEAEVESYRELEMEPGSEAEVYAMIPPPMFPKPGRQASFQIDYQEGRERPVQHIIQLAR